MEFIYNGELCHVAPLMSAAEQWTIWLLIADVLIVLGIVIMLKVSSSRLRREVRDGGWPLSQSSLWGNHMKGD